MRHMGWKIEDTFLETENINKELLHQVLNNWLLIYDEFLKWFIMFSSLLFSAENRIAEQSEAIDPASDDRWRAFTVLTGAITSQLIAIRRLVEAGLDFPAKQIVRCLNEYLDLSSAINLDKQLRDDFLRLDDLDGANEFWKTHLMSSRTKKGTRLIREDMINRIMPGLVDKRSSAQWGEFRKQEDKILHACIHPNFVAAYMATFGNIFDEKENSVRWPKALGVKTELSVRTLSYAVTTMLEYILVGYMPDQIVMIPGLEPALMKDEHLSIIYNYVKHGRSVLIELGMYVAANLSAPELSLPEVSL